MIWKFENKVKAKNKVEAFSPQTPSKTSMKTKI